MSTGFEIFLKNAKRVKNDHLAQTNLERFKKIYSALRDAPPEKNDPYIIEIESEIVDYNTVTQIKDFLINIEKWPVSNIGFVLLPLEKIRICLYLELKK